MWLYRLLSLLPFQLIAGSAAVCSMGRSQRDSSRSDFPTWPWVTSREAAALGKPKASRGCCKSCVRTPTSPPGLSAWRRGGFGAWGLSAFGAGGADALGPQEGAAVGLSPTPMAWIKSWLDFVPRHGCLGENLPVQRKAEAGRKSRAGMLGSQQTQPDRQLRNSPGLEKHQGVEVRASH